MANTTDERDKALNDFIFTVNATGGAVRHPDGTTGVAIDEDWIDLGEAYLRGCAALVSQQRITLWRRYRATEHERQRNYDKTQTNNSDDHVSMSALWL